jgi:hypothetical protein
VRTDEADRGRERRRERERERRRNEKGGRRKVNQVKRNMVRRKKGERFNLRTRDGDVFRSRRPWLWGER